MIGTRLFNQAGVIVTGKWKLEGGNIINSNDTTKGFGVANDTTIEVDVDATLSENHTGQHWEFGVKDGKGYFTIKHLASGKYLTAFTADKLKIGGM